MRRLGSASSRVEQPVGLYIYSGMAVRMGLGLVSDSGMAVRFTAGRLRCFILLCYGVPVLSDLSDVCISNVLYSLPCETVNTIDFRHHSKAT